MIGKRMLIALLCCSLLLGGCMQTLEAEDSSVPSSNGIESSEVEEAPEENAVIVTENPDFRNVKWGMTREEVKVREDAELIADIDEGLMYSTELTTLDMFLCYYFDNEGRLYQAIYGPNYEHSNDNLYITDYEGLKENLSKMYGKPDNDRDIWVNSLFQGDPEYYGLAISTGDYTRIAQWKTGKTEINLVLSGDNYEVLLNLGYTSTDYKPPENNYGL